MSGSNDPSLPCPLLNIRIDLPSNPAEALGNHLQRLPAKPGVYLFLDDSRATLAFASTANLRRMIASRLEPHLEVQPTRRVHYRALIRTILATTVGSAFEADWAYLQLARIHVPRTYRSMLDRWQAWFVAIDPSARFPQFVKTARPGRLPAGDNVLNFGPFADKHAAARYMDLLQDVFDLCRYHHILVRAPRGAACAYKEMGRCPAPCDGTVSMEHYHGQIRRAMDFAGAPFERWRQDTEEAMKRAADSLEFENAGRLREQLERSEPASKPSFAHVRALNEFHFVAIARGERKHWARLFLIRGGWIEPICDLRTDIPRSELNGVVKSLQAQSPSPSIDWSDDALENIGMVCWHLFRPRAKTVTLELLRLDQHLTTTALSRALRRITRNNDDAAEALDAINEHEMESGSPPAT